MRYDDVPYHQSAVESAHPVLRRSSQRHLVDDLTWYPHGPQTTLEVADVYKRLAKLRPRLRLVKG